MSTAVATIQRSEVTPSEWQIINEQARALAESGEMIPAQYRKRPNAILAAVIRGRELGLGLMGSLQAIDVIDGKAALNASAVTALIRAHGHSLEGESSAQRAVVVGTRADNGNTMTVEWTIEDAKRAGLLDKKNWQRYPAAMLWARAVTQLGRMLFADCAMGMTFYTPEELGAEVDEDGNIEVEAVRTGPARLGTSDVEFTEAVFPEITADDVIDKFEKLTVEKQAAIDNWVAKITNADGPVLPNGVYGLDDSDPALVHKIDDVVQRALQQETEPFDLDAGEEE